MKLKVKEKEICLLMSYLANEGMIVNDKTVFEEWFIEDEFAVENVLDDNKAQIGNLLKKIDVIPRMELLPESSVSSIPNFRQISAFVNTLDEILSVNTESSKDTLNKEENKVGIIMDDDDLMETKLIDHPISNNPKIKRDFDLDQLNLKTIKNIQILTSTTMTTMTI